MVGDLAAVLSWAPLLRDLSADELQRVAEMGRVERWARGAVLLEEGTVGPRLVVLLEGRVAIVKRDRAGVEHPIAECGPGQVIGEMALLLQQPRTATVRALEPLRVFVLDPEDFRAMVAADDPAALKMTLALSRTLAARLAEQNRRMVDLLEQTADQRKRAELQRVHEELHFRWDLPHA